MVPHGPGPLQIGAADVVGATVTGGDQLVIWHMPLKGKGKSEKPERQLVRTPPIRLCSVDQAAAAAELLRRACCWWGRPSPPRLLVVVNPASGPGRGPKLYEEEVAPVLAAAGLVVMAYTTQAQAHATEIVQQRAAGSVDAVAAIGGDGTTHEVLQGLLRRPDWEAMRHTPFAQVPCGSGNALAACSGEADGVGGRAEGGAAGEPWGCRGGCCSGPQLYEEAQPCPHLPPPPLPLPPPLLPPPLRLLLHVAAAPLALLALPCPAHLPACLT